MTARRIRRAFLDFFAARDHAEVASSSLVPASDPTLLFVNAGMVQFKDLFLGRESRPYRRAVTVQRCMRAGGKHNDLDNVGFTPRHHTLFEMLGNFSFGDYFKREAIAWGWEFLTGTLGLAAERLAVTVYDGRGESAAADDEAYELWTEWIPRDRIYRCAAKDNFWMMGDTGPCGPCSEIHVYAGDRAPPDATRAERLGPSYEDDRYTELWNLVFMQYDKQSDGTLVPLPRPSVDTGAGLERLAAVVGGFASNYETDLLRPLVDTAKRLAGVSGPQGERESAYQVIADHSRATAFLIADGVFPDRAGRSYVLRRIMRRAIRYGTEVGLDRPFFHEVCAEVVEQFADVHPELKERAATIAEVVRGEEESFRRTLSRGLRRLDAALRELPEGASAVDPDLAADLYDTYGFPLDLTAVIAREHGLVLDEPAAEQAVHRRQGVDRDAPVNLGQERGVADVYFAIHRRIGDSTFVGYEKDDADGVVAALIVGGREVAASEAGDEVELVLDLTPFYAESGGQVGDRGKAAMGEVELEILDVIKPVAGLHVHRARVVRGTLRVGDPLHLAVDAERRAAIRRNHSATHLLHQALREVLGPHVVQKGSLVAPDRLRFDFAHTRALTVEQREEIERRVNARVLGNLATEVRTLGLEQAKAAGAIGLFGEKYGDRVRVVAIAADSVELCGGTHVARAGDIGAFAVVGEGAIAQGVRRIEAVTGMGAVAHLQLLAASAGQAAALLHAAAPEEIPDRVVRLQGELREREREVADLRRKLATSGEADEVREVAGIKVLVKRVAVSDPKALREAADVLRNRLGSAVVVLGAPADGKAMLLVAVTRDLQDRVHAGKLVGELAPMLGGRGGGRPDLAQAGGPAGERLDDVLKAVPEALERQLRAT